MPDRKTPSHLFEGVIGLRDHLRVSYAPEWHPAYEQEGGVTAVGFPVYPDWLWEGIWDGIYLLDFLGVDYRRHYEEFRFINEQEAGEFTLEQVVTWFVIFGNRERISEGLIGAGAQDGTIYLIANRLLELLQGEPETHPGGRPTD